MRKVQFEFAVIAGLGAMLALSANAAVICVDPGKVSCEATIQAGVNAAASGDTVRVASGLYEESVTIATAGVTLQGSRDAFIDPSTPTGNAVTVNANDVVIKGIFVRNGGADGIELNTVSGVVIDRVNIQSPSGDCIQINGASPNNVVQNSTIRSCGGAGVNGVTDTDGLHVVKNLIEGAQGGINAVGDDVLVEGNTINRSIDDDCISVIGNMAEIVRNRATNCDSDDVANVTGNDALIERNTVSGGGISVTGNSPVVSSNRVSNQDGTGIEFDCGATCTGALISRNQLTNVGYDDSGISASTTGAGLTIENNRADVVGDIAMDLSTTSATVTRNRTTSSGGDGGDECWDIAGNLNTVSRNQIANCMGDGIQVNGDSNTIERNRISLTGDDGIDVAVGSDSNTLIDNQASDNSDSGIEISVAALGNDVSGNRVSGVRFDYCNGDPSTTGTDTPDGTGAACGVVDD